MNNEFECLLFEINVRAWNAPFQGNAHHSADGGGQHGGVATPLPAVSAHNPFSKANRLSNHLGLAGYEFPKPEELSKEQLYRITDAMEEMWKAWHIIPEFEPGMLSWDRYKRMRDYLEKEIIIPSEGSIHVRFSNNDAVTEGS